MRLIRTLAAAASLALLVAAGCSSGPSAHFDPSETLVDEIADGEPATGNVRVTFRQLDPRYPPTTTSIVNGSSEHGQRLRSGRVTSSETRVATDEQVGQLLATFREIGFFENATPMRLGELPELDGRKGAVVVEEGSRSVGLMLVRGQGLRGSPIPAIYRDCKNIVLQIHNQLPGFDVRTNVEGDPEDIFRDRPIRPLERGR